MKFSEQWLRQWVDPKVSTEQLAHQLTMAGLEVDAVEPVAPKLDNVVVGRVIAMEPHPNADKLRVCQVDVGKGDPLNIVCGAPNVEKDGRYPVALIGAELPGGFKIKKAKLRGVESYGMLCSAKEIELSDQAEGLMTLPNDAPVGEALVKYLQLNDHSIELGLTPNRADCLGIRGIAREVAVINDLDFSPKESVKISSSIKDELPIDIKASEHCPRYIGRVIKNINPKSQTPMWMQEQLRRSGLRSISPVVDVTNYVLLELGQPMHAFDLNKLHKGIVVRLAHKNEKITLLDGQELKLSESSLVIADQKKAQALAGIMGGNDSAVTDDTQHIFLESAFFNPTLIAGKARSYGLHTDSSHRFERGVDPQLQRQAAERATELLLDIVGGEPGPICEAVFSEHIPQSKPIQLRHSRLEKVLGVYIEQDTITQILLKLGMEVLPQDDQWEVIPPSFRFDIEREIDLVEEIARIYGYNQIASAKPVTTSAMVSMPEARVPLSHLQRVLLGSGYQEAITYSFVDPELQKLIDPQQTPLMLANPISADMSVMRTSLWPGLIQAAMHNINRQQENVRLFETGLRFVPQNDDSNQEPITQDAMVAGVCYGLAYPKQWALASRAVDFFDVKNTIDSLLNLTGQADKFIYIQDKHLALHPGQSARIVRSEDGSQDWVGWVGALHPAIAQKLDLAQPLYLFELQLESIGYRKIPKYAEVSKFPAIRRDLAIVVDENLASQAVSDCIKRVAPDTLKNLQLFDVYTGQGIESGRKSLAYGLTLQKQDQTLTDDEVNAVLSNIMSILNKELGATLRE
ncbi:phenylalanine--tRNA ligase subunit beta [Kaarinaea lacus]